MENDTINRLKEAVSGHRDVLILTHNNPDPDAMASAAALRHLLAPDGVAAARLAYGGFIGRAENRALARSLDAPFDRLAGPGLPPDCAIVLVDAQPGTGNNMVPADAEVCVVIDHHPMRSGWKARFSDLRPDVGATSTILTQYLQAAAVDFPPALATALFYGIKTDTMGLGRGAGAQDVEAYFYLQKKVDTASLSGIEHPQVPAAYFRNLSRAIEAAQVCGHVVTAFLGTMDYPDLGAEMADLLLRLEGTDWVLCTGVYDNDLVLSIRAQKQGAKAGSMVRSIVGKRGTAGGHGSMAGGHMPLGNDSPEDLAGLVRGRLLAGLGIDSATGPRSLI